MSAEEWSQFDEKVLSGLKQALAKSVDATTRERLAGMVNDLEKKKHAWQAIVDVRYAQVPPAREPNVLPSTATTNQATNTDYVAYTAPPPPVPNKLPEDPKKYEAVRVWFLF
jgi:hypothetical protein